VASAADPCGRNLGLLDESPPIFIMNGQVKEQEMRGAYSAHGKEAECMKGSGGKTRRKKSPLGRHRHR
jgi:hypothetical protein